MLGLVTLLLLSGYAHSQPTLQVQGAAAGEGERFRAELLAAAAVLQDAQSLTGRAPAGAPDLAAVTARIRELDADALATVREAIVAEIPGWGNVVTTLGAEASRAMAAARAEVCSGDLDYGDFCGAPTGTVFRQVLQDVWYVLDLAALVAQGICDAAPSGDVNVINTVVCPVAAVLKILARGGQFEFDLFQFCAGEGTAVTVDAIHCHLDDAFRFTDDDELDAQTTVLLAKMQEILDQLSGLQRATCDIGRLVTTPSGQRYSDIDVCQGEPGFPYDWNAHGVGVGGGLEEASVRPAVSAGTLGLELHLSQGTMVPTLYLPAAGGGILEQVRELVAGTISAQERIGYAPERTAEARTLLQEADRLFANRDYAPAYQGYGAAYRALIPEAGVQSAPAAIDVAPEVPDPAEVQLGASRLPAVPGLGPIAPNPVTGVVRYSVRLPVETLVTVRVYAVDGRLVGTLVDGSLPAGATELGWDPESSGGRLASGVYFLRLDAGRIRESRKFVVTR
jgi:hypothetical protein